MKIVASIKLSHKSIIDFDIDRNNYYVSVVSSEGDVKIYDIEMLQKSDEKVTSQKVRLASRDTISYHKYFTLVTEEQMVEGLKKRVFYGPEGCTTFDDSFKFRDATNRIGQDTFDRLDISKSSSRTKTNQ